MAGVIVGGASEATPHRATTVALLERKPTISRDLFSRYWRDVHGVTAARVRGFESYVQHHVTPHWDLGAERVEAFEGIAVVTFAVPEDREGLVESELTRHIHRDESNVFRRALLYNLFPGASNRLVGDWQDLDGTLESHFLVIPEGVDGAAIARGVVEAGAAWVVVHDLAGADPAGWNDTDVDDGGQGRRFAFLVQCLWADRTTAMHALLAAVQGSNGKIAAYRVDASYAMVENGRPTLLGLRGLDAVRTIDEAGADNQRDPEVLRAIYGPDAA